MASDNDHGSKGILGHVTPAPGIGLPSERMQTALKRLQTSAARGKPSDDEPSPAVSIDERCARALESIAASLEKLANPPVTVIMTKPTLVPDDE